MQSYFHSKTTPVDFPYLAQDFDEEDCGTLDGKNSSRCAIDDSADLSPHPAMADSRRESFATAPALFSPKTEDWQSVDMQSIPSNNPFIDQQDGNTFMRLDHDSSSHTFGQPANVWAMNHSTSATPMPQFDGNMASAFDANATIFQGNSHAQLPFANPGNMFASLGTDAHHAVASPPDDWSAVGAGMSKKRPGSPHIRSHNEMRRGDGIRKRNARFDIPPDHNLSNIDQLIAQSTDEQEIKDLKQQKRLLRNRQAALDSRQRKKLHTERLEDEKKQYTSALNELEMEVHALKAENDQLRSDNQAYASYIDSFSAQKDEMIRTHTVEARELRKKVSTLTEHIQHLEGNGVPTPGASSNAFGGAYTDLDGMCMPGGWDNANFLNSYGMAGEQSKTAVPTSAGKKPETLAMSENDKASTQGGLLFMLFLVGAFVMSSQSPPTLPRASEDVRVASAALLNNVLKEAGENSAATQLQPAAPQPSSVQWQNMGSNAHMTGMSSDGAAPPMLGELNNFLQPTQQQNNEQLFSLSAAQYNGVSDQSFIQNAAADRMGGQSQDRKTLAAALSEIRATNKQTGTADVYTRSLLWDQIPRDVVRNFIKMVAENNNAAHIDPQQCDEALS